MHAALATVIGGYADRRETMSTFANPVLDFSDGDRWVDFIADTGDGWGATMSVLHTATRPYLDLPRPRGRGDGDDDGRTVRTQRGSVLILGGDMVYPTASTRDYEDRLTGPLRSTWAWTEGRPPTVLAVPGNHDWYDGLSAFLRVFCAGGWLGAWRSVQTRSYFAARLPGGWWLWGVDVQLGGYVDRVQLDWFGEVSDQLEPGSPVVVCLAQPTWVRTQWGEGDVDAYVTTDYFLRNTVTAAGGEVRVAIAGDHHHYARYQSAAGVQLITAGTGGAFLHGTRGLPDPLHVPPTDSRDTNRSPSTDYHLAASYPDADTSRRLARNAVRLPFRNGGLPVPVGAAYVAMAALLAVASDPLATPAEIAERYVRSPVALLVTLLLAHSLRKLTKSRHPLVGWGIGVAHAATHVALVLALAGTAGWALASLLGSGDPARSTAGGVALAVAVGVGGGLGGSWVLALWLWLAWRLFGLNNNELFSADRIEDHKGFLRLHLTEAGDLTIYPVMLDGTCRTKRWRLRPRPANGGADEPWFEPVTPLQPRLVDGPVTVARSAESHHHPAAASRSGRSPS